MKQSPRNTASGSLDRSDVPVLLQVTQVKSVNLWCLRSSKSLFGPRQKSSEIIYTFVLHSDSFSKIIDRQ